VNRRRFARGRNRSDIGRNPAGLRRELADVGEGRAGPLPPPTAAASSNAWRMLGSTGGGSLEINVAAHSPNNDAERR